jgi:succinate dehydrogenase/fumarate reductase-like Fe-S protein
MLFVSAKISHLNVLPQGQPERETRVVTMVEQMDAEGFGGCTNTGECTNACPKGIPQSSIARLNGTPTAAVGSPGTRCRRPAARCRRRVGLPGP